VRRLNPPPAVSAGGGYEVKRLTVATNGQTDFEIGAVAVDGTGDPLVLAVTIILPGGASYPASRADWQIDGTTFRWGSSTPLVAGYFIDVNYAPA
jgi:hypothetical protein